MVTKGRGFNLGERKYVLTFFQNKKNFDVHIPRKYGFHFYIISFKKIMHNIKQ